MSWQQVLLEVLKLVPAEIELVDQGIHAMMNALASGQTEEQAVAAARAVMETAIDAMEAAEK